MSEHDIHPSGNRWFIALAATGLLLVVLVVGWVVIGRLTLTIPGVGHSGGGRFENPWQWYHPRYIAVINGEGAGSQPFARALQGELMEQHWVQQVVLIEPGQPTHEPIDFFILVGGVTHRYQRDGLAWSGEAHVKFSGGAYPWRVTIDSGLAADGGAPHFATDMSCDAYGKAMAANIDDYARYTAKQMAEQLRWMLDPAKSEPSPMRPASFFGDDVQPMRIKAMDQLGAQLLWQGPGYLRNHQAFWMLRSQRQPVELSNDLAERLRVDGWQVTPINRLGEYGMMQLFDATRGRWELSVRIPAGAQRDDVPLVLADDENICWIICVDRFTDDQMAAAIDDLFDTQPGIKPLLQYESRMTDAQRRRLLPLLEADPQETTQWYVDMAGRYLRLSDDKVQAGAMLRRAQELALADGDLIYVHHVVLPLAQKLASDDWPRRWTAEQLRSAGAVDLSAGQTMQVRLNIRERFNGFVFDGDRLYLFSLQALEGKRVRYTAWCPPAWKSGTVAFEREGGAYERLIEGFALQWTASMNKRGEFELSVRTKRP